MENKNDGGPVLPVLVKKTTKTDENGEEKSYHYGFAGLSIRDYFAAKAMQGLISRVRPDDDWPANQPDPERAIADSSYLQADAMLKARET